MQEVPHSVHGRTHEMNVTLTISGHELLFILLDFMVQIDYWLHDECTYQAVNRYYARQYALSIVTPTARARTAFKYALLLLSVARQLILMTAVRI